MCEAHLELIRPISKQCVLYVAGHELIERSVLVFQLPLQWCHATERRVHLRHVPELHDDHPFWQIWYAAETHLASGDAIGQHAVFADEVIKKTPHVCDPVQVTDVTFFVCPYGIEVAHVIGPRISNPAISDL